MDELYYAKKKADHRKEAGKFKFGQNHKRSRWEDSNANSGTLNKP